LHFSFKRYIKKVLEEREEKISIDCLCSFGKGLIAGCEGGSFGVWMKNEDPDIVGTSKDKGD
jgi:hypothetical protein